MTETVRAHVLIAGVTARALAVSAARAGYQVTAVDGFGDLDLQAVAEVIALRSEHGTRYDPRAVAAAGETVPAGMIAYTSNLENHPTAVARLARGRILLGNSPAVLTKVRNPIELMRRLRHAGFETPDTRATPAPGSRRRGSWLLKPRRSGGGHGVKLWRHSSAVSRHSYLQELVTGIPGSVIFAANGHEAVTLGLSRQLVGDARFGAHRFRYCGSLLGGPATPFFPRQVKLLEVATAMAAVISREFGLVGLNGIDFIAHDGVPYPIEVNPRYSASMELLERAHQLSVFEMHARACRGILPEVPHPPSCVHGKAIVFARREVTLGDTRSWIGSEFFGDVPHPGERIKRGRPICTVFAAGADASSCRRLLLRRAASVYRTANSRAPRAA